MEPGIFTGLFQKTINTVVAIGSLFYSSIDGVKADFSLFDIDVSQDVIIVSTQLIHCYSDGLDQIFKSGETVKIYYQLDLFSEKDSQPIYSWTLNHSIRYSLLDKSYEVYKSEIETVLLGLDFNRAKIELAEINAFPTMEVTHLEKDILYYFRITAWMDNIQLQGMEKSLNLMYYWSRIRPVKESSEFNGSISIQ